MVQERYFVWGARTGVSDQPAYDRLTKQLSISPYLTYWLSISVDHCLLRSW